MITITGTNDVPVALAAVAAVVEDAMVSGSVVATDADAGETATLTYALVSAAPVGLTFNSNGTYTFDASSYDSLPDGQQLVLTIPFTASDTQSTSASANLVITITGTNDVPVAQAAVAAVAEDASITGSVVATDADAGETATLTYALVSTAPAGLTFNADGTYTFDASSYDAIAQGETLTLTIPFTANDGVATSAAADLVITVTGSNDAPTISAAVTAGAVTEDSLPTSATGTITFDDLDLSDAHTTSVAANGANALGGLLTASVTDAATGAGDGTVTWNYSVANAALQYLAAGQTATESFTVTIDDGHGGMVSQGLTVTVTGTNDAPIVAAIDVTGAVAEAVTPVGNLTDSGTIAFTDVDLTDVHSVSAVTPSVGALGSLSAGVTADSTGSGLGGVVTWNYSVAASAVEFLAAGQTRVETFTFNVEDGQGGSVPRTVSVTITGSNDAPDIRAVTTDSATASLTETNTTLSSNGTLTVTDADTTDTVSSSVTGVTLSGTTGGLTAANVLGMLTVSPTSGLAANSGDVHNLTWNFNSGTQAFDFLGAGQSLTLNYTVQSSDNNAAGDTQLVSLTITGTNDAATDLIFTATGAPGNGQPNGAIGQMSLIDPDGGAAPYTYSATALTATTLAGGIAVNFAGDLVVSSAGVVTASNVDTDRVYELTVQVTQGAAAYTETFSVVVGTNAGDTVSGGYTNGDDVIYALGNADIILAGTGNDVVFGQQANDQINGGDGNDVLNGGGGNDTFVFNTALSALTNVDTIQDFEANGNDKIQLDDDIFSAFSVGANTTLAAANFAANSGGNATTATQFILYDTATGNLYYDADGSGAGAKVLFATLTLAGVTGAVDSTDFVLIP